MIPYLPYLLAIVVALMAAWRTAADIKLRRGIYHGSELTGRAVIMLLAALSLASFELIGWWTALAQFPGTMLLLSFAFRPALNRLRKPRKTWWYMGPVVGRGANDSTYDGLWIRLSRIIRCGVLRGPAILASLFELSVCATSIYLTWRWSHS